MLQQFNGYVHVSFGAKHRGQLVKYSFASLDAHAVLACDFIFLCFVVSHCLRRLHCLDFPT